MGEPESVLEIPQVDERERQMEVERVVVIVEAVRRSEPAFNLVIRAGTLRPCKRHPNRLDLRRRRR